MSFRVLTSNVAERCPAGTVTDVGGCPESISSVSVTRRSTRSADACAGFARTVKTSVAPSDRLIRVSAETDTVTSGSGAVSVLTTADHGPSPRALRASTRTSCSVPGARPVSSTARASGAIASGQRVHCADESRRYSRM